MSITLVVSFHGGSSGHNNLHSYPGDAKILATGSSEPSLTKAELRGFTLGTGGDSYLYVVNGYKDSSEILQYAPQSDGTYGAGKVWAKDHLDHPFDAVWGPGGDLYVSNQDPSSDGQIRVTVYSGSGAYQGEFAEGFNELRGIAWAGDTLWVADEKGGPDQTGAVIAYANQGQLPGSPTGASIAVTDPVHVLYDGARYLYIGSESGNCVYAYDTAQCNSQTLAVVASSTASVPIDATGGLAIATDSSSGIQYLYVCSREGKAINQYQLDSSVNPPTTSNASVVQTGLGDDPEFVGVLAPGAVFN
jgi:hypothetical protein